MNSRRFTEQYLPCFPNERNSTPSAAAVRDFRPLYVRLGPEADITRFTKPCPLYPRKRTWSRHLGMSALCRYCCKSPKLPGDKLPAIRRTNRRPPICVLSITLPRSPVSLSSGDEAPHIFTRKSCLQPDGLLHRSKRRARVARAGGQRQREVRPSTCSLSTSFIRRLDQCALDGNGKRVVDVYPHTR